ncbi:hypothetical protein L1987_24069 [Smallanthus sonchifolius]|uniref:Uncharacterized protein n=1 Tax=Smallanthus sonchifolius TaxID=185202 RepID=A0ACB9IKV6_9ASTR|nr:hypothetical protein L1987_24069 [Smallanthus sonchifolius]
MDPYCPTSPVYRPEEDSDWEEDTGSPVHRSPTPAAARSRFDVRVDWIRNTDPRLRTPGSPIYYSNDYSGAHLGYYLLPSGKIQETLEEASTDFL